MDALELFADPLVEPGARTAPRRAAPRPDAPPSLVSSGYLGVVPDRLARHMLVMMGADYAQIHARDPEDPDSLIVVASDGCDPAHIGDRIPAGNGVVAHALRSGQPVVTPRDGTGDLLGAAAPVARDGRLAGVVSVGTRGGRDAFGVDEVDLLCAIAELAASALERFPRLRAVERAADAQVAALATAMEVWDTATGPHAADVVAVARICARHLGLSTSEQLELELAARLHDVGKIRLSRALLERPGALTPEEYRLVQLHPIWGAELVSRVPGLGAVALMIRHHHERVDGTGYPAGLDGDRIPLPARVVTVADAYATMVAGRPYRTPIPPANAVEELRIHAGRQFDGDVVEALAETVGVQDVVVPLPTTRS
jgi:HD domain/GAF domain